MVKPIRLMGQFPPLPPGRAVRQILRDGLLGQWRLLAVTAVLPMILALLVDFAGTLILELRGQRGVVLSLDVVVIAVVTFLLIELVVGGLYTTNVTRLLGIGIRQGRLQATPEWRSAFTRVFLRLASLYLPGGLLIGTGFLGYLLIQAYSPVPQVAPLLVIIPGLVVLLLYTRFCFVVTAAAVGAPYTFGDSMRATGGITMLMLGLHLLFCVPLLLVQLGLQSSAASPSVFGLSYFGYLVLTQMLFLLRVAVFTVVNLVCFVNRTGWAPGAHRI